MMDVERSRTRRERTFVGSECAVCEEPLEHTLRGERILQFSCGHVSHEACFYEYIKEFESQYCPTCNAPLGLDTSRGGNILDLGMSTNDFARIEEKENKYKIAPTIYTDTDLDVLEKLGNIVRSVSLSDSATQRSGQSTPTPWDYSSSRQAPSSHDVSTPSANREAREPNRRDSRDTSSQRDRVERLTNNSRQQHTRNDSVATATGSSANENDSQLQNSGRRHDYDVQAMESDLSPRQAATKNPIPSPIVTVRSEFPSLNRSRQQQSLTCLVTIEVPDGNWQPDLDDLRHAPPPPQEEFQQSSVKSPVTRPMRPPPYEEGLEDMSEELRLRVDNWHGLDFQRYVYQCAPLELHKISLFLRHLVSFHKTLLTPFQVWKASVAWQNSRWKRP